MENTSKKIGRPAHKIKSRMQSINVRIPGGYYDTLLQILSVREESLSNFCRTAITDEIRSQEDYLRRNKKLGEIKKEQDEVQQAEHTEQNKNRIAELMAMRDKYKNVFINHEDSLDNGIYGIDIFVTPLDLSNKITTIDELRELGLHLSLFCKPVNHDEFYNFLKKRGQYNAGLTYLRVLEERKINRFSDSGPYRGDIAEKVMKIKDEE